jgi:hypothetical protein
MNEKRHRTHLECNTCKLQRCLRLRVNSSFRIRRLTVTGMPIMQVIFLRLCAGTSAAFPVYLMLHWRRRETVTSNAEVPEQCTRFPMLFQVATNRISRVKPCISILKWYRVKIT